MEAAGSSETRLHGVTSAVRQLDLVCFRTVTRGSTSWSTCVSSWTSSRRTTLACAMLTTRDRGYEFGTWCNNQGITDWGGLRGIFEGGMTSGWGTLRNEVLFSECWSDLGGLEWAKCVAYMGRWEIEVNFLVREPEGRKPLLKPTHRFEGYLKSW